MGFLLYIGGGLLLVYVGTHVLLFVIAKTLGAVFNAEHSKLGEFIAVILYVVIYTVLVFTGTIPSF